MNSYAVVWTIITCCAGLGIGYIWGRTTRSEDVTRIAEAARQADIHLDPDKLARALADAKAITVHVDAHTLYALSRVPPGGAPPGKTH